MSKFRSLILIVGLLLIAVAAALLTVLVLYATGTILTDPIELVYSVGSNQKIYDGTPLTLEENDYILESGDILEDHTAKVQIVGSQTDVGASEATLEVKIFDKNGFDVSKEYAVKINVGTLTVEKRAVSVVVPDSQVYYSGREVEFKNDYELIEGTSFAPGHKLAGLGATLMNAGESLPKDITPLVYDAFGTNVTENYDIHMEVGDVTIVPRPLTIKPKKVTKIYDGVKITATEYEITEGSLAVGQTASVKIVNEAGNAAEAVNVSATRIMIDKRNFAIYDGVTPVTQNYDVDYDATDFLTIEKRPVTVRTASDTFVYDGEEHYNDKITLSGEFAPGQTFKLKSSKKVVDAEEDVDNEIVYEILDGTTDVSGNYLVTVDCGKLTVTPMKLTVQTKSYEKVYDGKSLKTEIDKDENNYTLSVALPSAMTLTGTVSDTVLNQTDVANGTFKLSNLVVKKGENTVSLDNFEITVLEGNYAITRKPVEITLKKIENAKKYVYGLKPTITAAEAFDAAQLTSYGLKTDDFKIIQDEDYSAGLHEYTAELTNTDVKNYEVTVVPSTVEIAKKKVTIQEEDGSGAKSVAYNGSTLYDAKLTNFKLSILNNPGYKIEEADFKVTFNVSDNYQSVKIDRIKVTSNSVDITSNLDVDYENFEIKVTVTKHELKVFCNNYFTSYYAIDASVLPSYVSVSSATPLASGDRLIINTVNHNGYDKYWVTSYKILNANGEDVTRFYDTITENDYGKIVNIDSE